MDILYGDKLNFLLNRYLFLLTEIVARFIGLCFLFALKFTKNASLRINFYKNQHNFKKMFGWTK